MNQQRIPPPNQPPQQGGPGPGMPLPPLPPLPGQPAWPAIGSQLPGGQPLPANQPPVAPVPPPPVPRPQTNPVPQFPSVQESGEEEVNRPAAAQQETAPFQPAIVAGEPPWRKMLIVFGAGFVLTVIPLLFGLPPYGIQFIAAVLLFLDSKKTHQEMKRLAGYGMAGMMGLMGLAVLFLGLSG